MEEVGPEPDITSILALLERYQAPRHGPGLPGGHMTFEEVAHAARHFPPGSWELLGPSPFPPSPRDPPVAITAPPPSPTADAAKAAVAVSPKSPPASVSSVANGAETAKVDLEAIDSSHSAPRERRLYRLVRSLARGFRGLFSRNRKSTASS
ncbi:hypothetical protein BGZ61DRAFT_475086 [Ilyonectria robusta]|uniref:uncharacterized protein n=1 Tax=Ilyonectria robusta TaxID=1079257 RepID=UPI001E8D7BEA|nr:uncharacterized protein BGZ61DRAFT_475086 [Ilyonectria robusta]KAH8729470.1 hypothetical protein BGZ61DRAFT_475086 [Ilyonectria robusta]